MKAPAPTSLSGDLVDEQTQLTLVELCRFSGLAAEDITLLVEEGVIEPAGSRGARWYFRGACLRRVRCAARLRRDLGVNWAGVALALELLDEIEQLRRQVRHREN